MKNYNLTFLPLFKESVDIHPVIARGGIDVS